LIRASDAGRCSSSASAAGAVIHRSISVSVVRMGKQFGNGPDNLAKKAEEGG
jgi:hypothetical protein